MWGTPGAPPTRDPRRPRPGRPPPERTARGPGTARTIRTRPGAPGGRAPPRHGPGSGHHPGSRHRPEVGYPPGGVGHRPGVGYPRTPASAMLGRRPARSPRGPVRQHRAGGGVGPPDAGSAGSPARRAGSAPGTGSLTTGVDCRNPANMFPAGDGATGAVGRPEVAPGPPPGHLRRPGRPGARASAPGRTTGAAPDRSTSSRHPCGGGPSVSGFRCTGARPAGPPAAASLRPDGDRVTAGAMDMT